MMQEHMSDTVMQEHMPSTVIKASLIYGLVQHSFKHIHLCQHCTACKCCMWLGNTELSALQLNLVTGTKC